MKSIKTMLLGIAFLIIAAIGIPLWMVGSYLGFVLFAAGGLAGIILCIKGYFQKTE